jgi:hypothetical protein
VEGIGGHKQRFKREDMVGIEVDAGMSLGEGGLDLFGQFLVRIPPRHEA